MFRDALCNSDRSVVAQSLQPLLARMYALAKNLIVSHVYSDAPYQRSYGIVCQDTTHEAQRSST
jgi:hypothetical protein